MKKKLFIILSIISIFFFNIDFVFAFELHSYDTSVSLFDKWGNDLPVCNDNFYYSYTAGPYSSAQYPYVVNGYPTDTQVCSRDLSPSLNQFKDVLPYHTRIDYTTHTGFTFSVMLATPSPLVIAGNGPVNPNYRGSPGSLKYIHEWLDSNGVSHVSYTLPEGLIFILAPNSCILTDSDTGDTYNCYSGYVNQTSSGGYFREWNNIGISSPSIQGWTTNTIDAHYPHYINYDFIMNSNLYNARFVTNYDLIDVRSNQVAVSKTEGFEFNTDKDLNIKYEEYALLIPKHNNSFNSYLWTDSNFYYDLSYFNSNTNTYDSQLNAGFDSISFGYLNGFNWFRWDFSFSSQDLTNNKVLRIFNHNEGKDLNIKYFSSDFDVRLMNKDSSNYTYNGVTYTNDWENLKNNSSQHIINNTYSVDMFNDFSTYTRNLPNLITSFSHAFVFIGTLITNAFNLFDSEMLTYFYVLFGLTIIMLLIMVLK